MRVDGVELPALLRVEEDLEGFLDAFEEGVVVRVACETGFFVRVVFEYFFPICIRYKGTDQII